MNAPLRTAVPAVSPRPATTTLIVRDGPPGLEVLMVRRSMQASFMPGAYVFPGGAVDPADGSTEAQARCDESPQALAARLGSATGVGDLAAAFAVAGLRECFEECGLWLGAAAPDAADWAVLRARLHGGENLPSLAAKAGLTLHTSALQPWAHWVTPVGLPKRFDTLFLLARAPLGQVASVDTHETTTLAWVHPPAALADQAQGSFQMEFATVSVMRSLQPHAGASAQALLDHAAGAAPIATVQPRLSLDDQGHIRGVLLPGQLGFDTAAGG